MRWPPYPKPPSLSSEWFDAVLGFDGDPDAFFMRLSPGLPAVLQLMKYTGHLLRQLQARAASCP